MSEDKTTKIQPTGGSGTAMNLASAVAMAVLVAGCGGGSRPSTYTPPPSPTVLPPPPPPVYQPSDFHTQEFDRSWGLEAVGADWAYAEGYTGSGVILGVLDFNFDLNSSELNVHPLSRDKDPAMVAIYEAQIGDTAPDTPHGHAVAVVAAGLKNGEDTHGVAYSSQVLLVDYFAGVDKTVVRQNGVDYHVSNPYTYLARNGAKVVNISIGYDEEDIISNPPTVSEKYVNDSAAYAIQSGMILVAAAGNSGDPEPMLSNLALLDEAQQLGFLDGPGAFIMVGAVKEGNEIATFSDRAGRAKDHYLVAPGVEVVAPWDSDEGPGLYYVNGTSFAAPHVTGAVGIILSRWPFLTGRQVADILFETATDLGAPGVDEIYGHGLLNLRNAIQPQGQVAVVVSGAGNSVGVQDIAVVMGQSFGDAQPAGLDAVMGLDKYGRDFYYDMRAGVRSLARGATPLGYFLEREKRMSSAGMAMGGGQFNLYVDDPFITPSFVAAQSQAYQDTVNLTPVRAGSLQGGWGEAWRWQLGAGLGLESALSAGSGPQGGVRLISGAGRDSFLSHQGTFGLVQRSLNDRTDLSFGVDMAESKGFARHPLEDMRSDTPRTAAMVQMDHHTYHGFGTASFTARMGGLVEEGAVLGSRSAGGFKLASRTDTAFAGLGAEASVGPVSVSARFDAGISRVKGVDISYFQGLNSFVSTAWAANIAVRNVGARNSYAVMSVSQPLRVENARLDALVASHIDVTTARPVFERRSSSLSPSGREVALEAAWRIERGSWSMQASLLQRFDAGHIKDQKDTAALIWLQKRF